MALGKKTGGRKKGTPNKATAELRTGALRDGVSPLAFMLEVMRDEERDSNVRLDAAKAAAPYIHPKLATHEIKGDQQNPLVHKVEIVVVDRAN